MNLDIINGEPLSDRDEQINEYLGCLPMKDIFLLNNYVNDYELNDLPIYINSINYFYDYSDINDETEKKNIIDDQVNKVASNYSIFNSKIDYCHHNYLWVHIKLENPKTCEIHSFNFVNRYDMPLLFYPKQSSEYLLEEMVLYSCSRNITFYFSYFKNWKRKIEKILGK